MNDFERARPHFENAWRINPSNYAARMLGSIEVNDGNYDRGIHLLEKALEFNPDDIQALFNLSGAQALSGDLETAYETALKA
jgi:tetratricopeptide (TPR) repeat protein